MNTPRRAVHIRSGEAGAGEFVDSWLDRHSVERTCCANVLDACTFILKSSTHVPDLAFVGADRLTVDDLAILQYLRETWPAVGIVLYGEHAESNARTRDTRTLVCPSRAALHQILATPPGRLLTQLREIAPPVGPATKADDRFTGPGERSAVIPRTSDDLSQADTKSQAPASEPLGLPQGKDTPRSHFPRPGALRSTLTPEELAILLEDTHD